MDEFGLVPLKPPSFSTSLHTATQPVPRERPPDGNRGESGEWHREPQRENRPKGARNVRLAGDRPGADRHGEGGLVDPVNAEDVSVREMDEPGSDTYEVVTNDHGIGVAMYVGTGLGDGVYPVEARFEEAEGAMRIAEVRVRFLPHPMVGYEFPR